MNIFKELAGESRGGRLLSRAARSPCAARRTVSGALQMAAELFQLHLRYSTGHLEARTPASPALKEAKFRSFQKMDTSLCCLYFYPSVTAVACRLNITVFNLTKILCLQVFPQRQLKDRDAVAPDCDSELPIHKNNLSLTMLFLTRVCSPKKLLWSRYLKRFIHSCLAQGSHILFFPSPDFHLTELKGCSLLLIPHVSLKHCS